MVRSNAILDKVTGKIITQIPFPPINCLAIEGGGVRGTAYAGAVKVLEKYGLLEEIEHIVGTSAGAIAALGLALGYSAEEIKQKLVELPMESFLEGAHSWANTPDTLAYARQAFSILTNKGHSLSTGGKLLEWLEAIVAAKLEGNKKATFKDLAEAKVKAQREGKPNDLKYLYVTGTNLSLQEAECEIFSHLKTPDMPLALAVRISSSVPTIFKFEQWNGYQYTDGGLKKNLCTNIFDKRQYLPPGYDFTDNGTNPGLLAIKIDNAKEINSLWGIKQGVQLNTITEITTAIVSAITQTVDAAEIREERLVLPLPDGDIQTLGFTITQDDKTKLILAAEKETQTFLENHAGAALAIQQYATIEDWLSVQSIENISALISAYSDMLASAVKDHADIVTYISFLKNYLNFRVNKLIEPNSNLTFTFPNYHIDLKPKQRAWHKKVMDEMNERLSIVNQQIVDIDEKIASHQIDIQTSSNPDKLHTELFESIKYLSGLYAHCQLLKEEKADLENKLGKQCRGNTADNQAGLLSTFLEHIRAIKQITHPTSPLMAILHTLNFIHPAIIYDSMHKQDNIVFKLNLWRRYDLQIYLIACYHYLNYRKSDYAQRFQDIYQAIFKTNLPCTMSQLKNYLALSGIETAIAAYQIEELIHFFEKQEQPKIQPSADIDQIFKTSTYSMFCIKNKPTSLVKEDNRGDVELSNIFKLADSPKESQVVAISQLSLSLFKTINNQPLDEITQDTTPAWFFKGL